ncbi:3',5'-cyclic-nucleotide phosphodiesterase [Haematococcus lacustris]|uniref:3',5'-cyclic-nucleotide phosphodiesterase n=1 Tax=Haematococcus lacustris TaxID=44745 RepID=A0A699ZG83_HAELA|nr:3',5'-cyclic-nucleotide phosphodiesterase [Haematococcus lacustris]
MPCPASWHYMQAAVHTTHQPPADSSAYCLKWRRSGVCGCPKGLGGWVSALEEELYRQGDREKAAGLPISPLFDRTKPGVSKSQARRLEGEEGGRGGGGGVRGGQGEREERIGERGGKRLLAGPTAPLTAHWYGAAWWCRSASWTLWWSPCSTALSAPSPAPSPCSTSWP